MRTRPAATVMVVLSLLTSVPLSAQVPASQGGTLGFYRFPALHG